MSRKEKGYRVFKKMEGDIQKNKIGVCQELQRGQVRYKCKEKKDIIKGIEAGIKNIYSKQKTRGKERSIK